MLNEYWQNIEKNSKERKQLSPDSFMEQQLKRFKFIAILMHKDTGELDIRPSNNIIPRYHLLLGIIDSNPSNLQSMLNDMSIRSHHENIKNMAAVWKDWF